jgi:hypothetical protein
MIKYLFKLEVSMAARGTLRVENQQLMTGAQTASRYATYVGVFALLAGLGVMMAVQTWKGFANDVNVGNFTGGEAEFEWVNAVSRKQAVAIGCIVGATLVTGLVAGGLVKCYQKKPVDPWRTRLIVALAAFALAYAVATWTIQAQLPTKQGWDGGSDGVIHLSRGSETWHLMDASMLSAAKDAAKWLMIAGVVIGLIGFIGMRLAQPWTGFE